LFPHWHNVQLTARVVGWAFFSPLVLNAPHFAFSYQVFYEGLFRRLRSPELSAFGKGRMILAGFVVPAAMFVYFSATMLMHSMTMMGAMTNAMLLLSGWHYARQGYGALITLSAYRRIFYGPRQKMILNANAYLIPVLAWVMLNSTRQPNMFYDIPYAGLNLPSWIAVGLAVPACIFGVLAIAVFLRIWLIDRRGIPVNGLTGYVCATYFWLSLAKINPDYYFLVPFFHALQYMPFIYKYKKLETAGREGAAPENVWHNARAFSSMVVFVMTGIVLGAVFMNFLPRLIDLTLLHYNLAPVGFSRNSFLVTFLLFINIHHFFIDYAFWRRDNKDVQLCLFGG
jgi:hypothetical protein